MKLSNVIIIILLAALCAAGWAAVVPRAEEGPGYDDYMAQARDYMDRGLYQRAAAAYLAAEEGAHSEENYLLAAEAYGLRYAEAPEDGRSDYESLLKTALAAYPANEELLERFLALYVDEDGSFQEAGKIYPVLKASVAAGRDEEEYLDLLARVRYDNALSANIYRGLDITGDGVYAVESDKGWNYYGGHRLNRYRDYLGPFGENGVAVTVETDEQERQSARLILTDTAFVMGIFEDPVTEAGCWAEGLVPVRAGGGWGYYDDHANYVFGDYDFAGPFQGGLAAVLDGRNWMLVDKEGEARTGEFGEIVLDRTGRYLVNGLLLVKEDGDYTVYNTEWERQAQFSADEVDVRTGDGLLAFREDDLWGFVDMTGKVVIEPAYAGARSFSNGLAAVEDESGLWGFIDRDGRVVSDFVYADAGYLDDNAQCPVRLYREEPRIDAETGEPMEEWTFLTLTLGIMEDPS